ncbi:hypothetical protein ACWD0A_31650 [Streptomyces sp. NPDC002867]
MECAYAPAADAGGTSGGSSYDGNESYGGGAAADGLVPPALGAGT